MMALYEKFLTGVQVNIFAAALLTLILLDMSRRPDRDESTQKVYWWMVLGNLTMVLIDIVVNILNGRDSEILRQIHILFENLDYMLAPMVGFFWAIYVEKKIYRHGGDIKRTATSLTIPVITNLLIVVLNTGRGFLFYIDESNVYHRGDMFWLSVAITYSYLLYGFERAVKNRNEIRRGDFQALMIFPLIPFLGGIVQVFSYEVTLMWTSTAISMLVIFINTQNDQMSRDHLTGLYNRRHMEKYMSSYIKCNGRGKLLGGIMIDVNDFKSINDKYGHVEGDRALERLGRVILRSFRKEDFVARYAGDEFIVLPRVRGYDDLERLVKRLEETLEDFNRERSMPYEIRVSIGYDIFDREMHVHSESFIDHIDDLMYKDKNG